MATAVLVFAFVIAVQPSHGPKARGDLETSAAPAKRSFPNGKDFSHGHLKKSNGQANKKMKPKQPPTKPQSDPVRVVLQ